MMNPNTVPPVEIMQSLIAGLEEWGWSTSYHGDDAGRPFLRFEYPDGQIIEVEMDGRTTVALGEYNDCIELTPELLQALNAVAAYIPHLGRSRS